MSQAEAAAAFVLPCDAPLSVPPPPAAAPAPDPAPVAAAAVPPAPPPSAEDISVEILGPERDLLTAWITDLRSSSLLHWEATPAPPCEAELVLAGCCGLSRGG